MNHPSHCRINVSLTTLKPKIVLVYLDKIFSILVLDIVAVWREIGIDLGFGLTLEIRESCDYPTDSAQCWASKRLYVIVMLVGGQTSSTEHSGRSHREAPTP